MLSSLDMILVLLSMYNACYFCFRKFCFCLAFRNTCTHGYHIAVVFYPVFKSFPHILLTSRGGRGH